MMERVDLFGTKNGSVKRVTAATHVVDMESVDTTSIVTAISE